MTLPLPRPYRVHNWQSAKSMKPWGKLSLTMTISSTLKINSWGRWVQSFWKHSRSSGEWESPTQTWIHCRRCCHQGICLTTTTTTPHMRLLVVPLRVTKRARMIRVNLLAMCRNSTMRRYRENKRRRGDKRNKILISPKSLIWKNMRKAKSLIRVNQVDHLSTLTSPCLLGRKSRRSGMPAGLV